MEQTEERHVVEPPQYDVSKENRHVLKDGDVVYPQQNGEILRLSPNMFPDCLVMHDEESGKNYAFLGESGNEYLWETNTKYDAENIAEVLYPADIGAPLDNATREETLKCYIDDPDVFGFANQHYDIAQGKCLEFDVKTDWEEKRLFREAEYSAIEDKLLKVGVNNAIEGMAKLAIKNGLYVDAQKAVEGTIKKTGTEVDKQDVKGITKNVKKDKAVAKVLKDKTPNSRV